MTRACLRFFSSEASENLLATLGDLLVESDGAGARWRPHLFSNTATSGNCSPALMATGREVWKLRTAAREKAVRSIIVSG